MASTLRRFFRNVLTFFPVQLVLLHARRSFLFLVFWLLLFGMAGGWFFQSLGFPFLFQTPEYLDKVGVLSFFIMGFVLGLFVMAFHVSSYIFYSYRFTFLATVGRPLYRFAINNSLIPFLFYLFYIAEIIKALNYEGFTFWQTLLCVLFLLVGSVLSIAITFTYFFSTTGKNVASVEEDQVPGLMSFFIRKDKRLKKDKDDAFVVTYLRNFAAIRRIRPSKHYDESVRLGILQQHHLHSALYFIAILIILVGLSFFSHRRYFMIPAGASLILLLTIYMMIFGAIFSWIKTWTISVILALLLLLNFTSTVPGCERISYASGMDYHTEPASYSYEHLRSITTDSIQEFDKKQIIKALEGWKKRQKSSLPRMVIINSSGGGLRSALYTLGSMQYLDSLSSGEFFNNTFIMFGSSGGMIGGAYFRELYNQKLNGAGIDPGNPEYLRELGTDILNPVGFSMVVNDLFINFNSYHKAGFKYPSDRGTAFERKFNYNSDHLLDYAVFAYEEQEKKGNLPLFVLSPTIINEGRRLIISPMGMSFLTHSNNPYLKNQNYNFDGVEYRRFFKEQQADSLGLVTALRMSSTFPYITPLVSLPSEPRMEVIDAGARDNDGLLLTMRFLHAFNEWIAENTSGVTIVQFLAARPIESEISPIPKESLSESFIKPVEGMFTSFGTLQSFSRAEVLNYAEDWLKFPLEVVQFDLLTRKNEISLSWHLTEREKKQIYNAIRSERLKERYTRAIGPVNLKR